jgi:YD repeat-containing protein
LQTIRELRVAGQGENPIDLSNPSNLDGKIIESQVWDANSRLVSVSDDKGNTTSYRYDNLNRLIETTFADGTKNTFVFDKDSNLVQFTDNNGSIVQNIYDAVNRPVQRNITPSTSNNVKGTTSQAFEFDGLSRITKATDNNDPNSTEDDSTVERKYDSLSRLVEEIQNSKVISYKRK